MRRDMELIIDILKIVEDNDEENPEIDIESDHFDYKTVQYHIGLMYQAGLLEVYEHSSFDGRAYTIKSLTWEGHEFVDAARNEGVLNKAKELAKTKGLDFASLPLDLAKELLTNSLKSLIGL